MKLSELHYIQLLDEARQSLITKDVDAIYCLKEIELRLAAGEEAVKKVAELEKEVERLKVDKLAVNGLLSVEAMITYIDTLKQQAAAGKMAAENIKQMIMLCEQERWNKSYCLTEVMKIIIDYQQSNENLRMQLRQEAENRIEADKKLRQSIWDVVGECMTGITDSKKVEQIEKLLLDSERYRPR